MVPVYCMHALAMPMLILLNFLVMHIDSAWKSRSVSATRNLSNPFVLALVKICRRISRIAMPPTMIKAMQHVVVLRQASATNLNKSSQMYQVLLDHLFSGTMAQQSTFLVEHFNNMLHRFAAFKHFGTKIP